MEINKFNYKSVDDIEEKVSSLGINPSFTLIKDKKRVKEILSQPIEVCGYTLKNRIAIQPMEGFDSGADFAPGELTHRRYDRFALSGAAVIWYEAVAVAYEGRSNSKQLCINDANADKFKIQVERIKEAAFKKHGFLPLLIMQATHSGRYSKPDGVPRPVIAYNKPNFETSEALPEECIIKADKLDRLVDSMGKAASLAEYCGFDGIDIKCCHGYLNNELLSAFERTDKYGGSFENRTRFYLDSVRAAKTSVKNIFITSRLNAYDGFDFHDGFGASQKNKGEYDLTETKQLISILHGELGMNFIDITAGNPYVNPHVNRPADILPYDHPEHPFIGIYRMAALTGELQKSFPSLPIISSALSYLRQFCPNFAASLIENGMTSLAGFGRMAFAYPEFVSDIFKNGEISSEKCCVTCGRCSLLMRNQSSTGCVIRDSDLYYPLYKKYVLKE